MQHAELENSNGMFLEGWQYGTPNATKILNDTSCEPSQILDRSASLRSHTRVLENVLMNVLENVFKNVFDTQLKRGCPVTPFKALHLPLSLSSPKGVLKHLVGC